MNKKKKKKKNYEVSSIDVMEMTVSYSFLPPFSCPETCNAYQTRRR